MVAVLPTNETIASKQWNCSVGAFAHLEIFAVNDPGSDRTWLNNRTLTPLAHEEHGSKAISVIHFSECEAPSTSGSFSLAYIAVGLGVVSLVLLYSDEIICTWQLPRLFRFAGSRTKLMLKFVEAFMFLLFVAGLPIAFQLTLPHVLDVSHAWELCGLQAQPGQPIMMPPCVTHWTALLAACFSFILTASLLVSTKRELWSLQPARLLGAHLVADMLLAAAVIAGTAVETMRGRESPCSSELARVLTSLSEFCVVSSEMLGFSIVIDLVYQLLRPLSLLDSGSLKRRNLWYLLVSMLTGSAFSALLYSHVGHVGDSFQYEYDGCWLFTVLGSGRRFWIFFGDVYVLTIVASVVGLTTSSIKLRTPVPETQTYQRMLTSIRWSKWCVVCQMAYWAWGWVYTTLDMHLAAALWLGLRGALDYFLLNHNVGQKLVVTSRGEIRHVRDVDHRMRHLPEYLRRLFGLVFTIKSPAPGPDIRSRLIEPSIDGADGTHTHAPPPARLDEADATGPSTPSWKYVQLPVQHAANCESGASDAGLLADRELFLMDIKYVLYTAMGYAEDGKATGYEKSTEHECASDAASLILV
jgi:hypothetical protein